jgi:hypothetical protein
MTMQHFQELWEDLKRDTAELAAEPDWSADDIQALLIATHFLRFSLAVVADEHTDLKTARTTAKLALEAYDALYEEGT